MFFLLFSIQHTTIKTCIFILTNYNWLNVLSHNKCSGYRGTNSLMVDSKMRYIQGHLRLS